AAALKFALAFVASPVFIAVIFIPRCVEISLTERSQLREAVRFANDWLGLGESMDRATGELEAVTVDAPCGRLAGERSGDVLVFRGIPFAKPPVGKLRWRMPEPAEPWP